MLNTDALIESNCYFLQQGLAMLGRMSPELFGRPAPQIGVYGVGSHLRHCLDHYLSFLEGLPAGIIDYDARRRDTRVEKDLDYARRVIADIVLRLRACSTGSERATLQVRQDAGYEVEQQSVLSVSSPQRELQFLVSHTVHHFALIALILRLQGFQVEENFGVAPSTLKFRRSMPACAQ